MFSLENSVSALEEILPEVSYNLESELINNSYLTATDDGYMRVFYNNEYVGIEYYDNDFNIQSFMSIAMEMDIWGGFYEGTDAYYLIEGCDNVEEVDATEVVRVIKYDKNWNRLGAIKITGNSAINGRDVSRIFDHGCVQVTEYNGHLFIATGREGYFDSATNTRHQGFIMIDADTESMNGKITYGEFRHSFAQYIENNNSDIYVVEKSDGKRCTNLFKFDASDLSTIVLKKETQLFNYGGVKTTGGTLECYASVDGMALSSDNILCVGTSIDQSEYDNVTDETPHNIYITVTPMSGVSEDSTEVKWLTDYTGDGKSFIGLKITEINDDKFMISWEESYSSGEDMKISDMPDILSRHTLHYIFIDGDGKKLGKEYTVNAAISDCQPIVKDSKVIYYSSGANMVNFYSIDSVTGEFEKKVYGIAGKNVQWNVVDNVLTISGTGIFNIECILYKRHPLSTASSVDYFYDNPWADMRDNIEKIIIKSGITAINAEQFKCYPNLVEVVIEDGVESIGTKAFYDCDNLNKITISSSVTEIGENILWTGASWDSDNSPVVNAVIHTPAGSYAETYAKENDIKYVTITQTIKGDVNNDGAFDVSDIVALQLYVLIGDFEINMDTADLCSDGKVNIFDLMALKRYCADVY
ncbi:MAG: leucine-rich repeat protein [Oscillospiraceae bacterium]|nr:leucine-rich repeat protein [Oscillospiraceae bacterium]